MAQHDNDFGAQDGLAVLEAAQVGRGVGDIAGFAHHEDIADELIEGDEPEIADEGESGVCQIDTTDEPERANADTDVEWQEPAAPKPRNRKPQCPPIFNQIGDVLRKNAQLFATTAQDNDTSSAIYKRMVDLCDDYDAYVKEFETV
jgi:hypothetical protein